MSESDTTQPVQGEWNDETANELGAMQEMFGIEDISEDFQQVLDDVPEEEFDKAVKMGVADSREGFALKKLKGNISSEQSAGGSGGKEIAAIMLGHSGIRKWSGDTGPREVLLGHGVVFPDDEPAGKATFVFDSTDGLDLDWLKSEVCNPFTDILGEFTISASDTVTNGYMINSTSDMSVQVGNVDSLPDDEFGRRDYVLKSIDTVELCDLGSRGSLSATEYYTSNGEERQVPADFGLDIKCIPSASITDSYADVADSGREWGVYTLMDDTVVQDDLHEMGVNGDADDGSRRNGFTAWCDVDKMEYGQGSICEFYGTVESGDDGQISMNVIGAYPISAEPVQNEAVADLRSDTDSDTEMI